MAQPLKPGAPKLVVAISIDQFSADLWDEYRSQFTGGLARIGSGAAFRNGYQSHAATETCPGHSTILTGDHPARTGIISNLWIDQSAARTDKSVYCAEDESVSGSNSSNYTVSPVHLLVPTLGELMKQARPGSRSVAVAGKDRAAVMMTGHQVDQRWFWNGKTFATDVAGAPVPLIVAKAQAARVSSYLSSLQTLVGNFVQVGPDGSKTKGDFYIQKPGKMRFEYDDPNPIAIVADGQTLVSGSSDHTIKVWGTQSI